jgi:hypothetical protein
MCIGDVAHVNVIADACPIWRFEAKFMLPWSFSEEGAAEKHMAQLQHNMWVTNARMSVLSIITGGGKWVEIAIAADSLYQHLLLTPGRQSIGGIWVGRFA